MTSKKILAIGAHIGDMELSAGGVLATNSLNGGSNVILALTAGERGNPKGISQSSYRIQKIKEANEFASLVNGKAIVFDYPDGELPNDEMVRIEVAKIIRKERPDVILTHWKSTMHKDHQHAHEIVNDASFYAGVYIGTRLEGKPHYASVYFCENWEDSEGFIPYIYVDITPGFDVWEQALRTHWFIMNSTSFPYYDYYLALARVNGCLNRTKYAERFAIFERQKYVRKEML